MTTNTEADFHRWYEIDSRTGCWVWQGAPDKDGYGQFRYQGRKWQAHRVSFLISNGTIDPKKQVDHLCRNRICVNPNHLEEVTCRENLMRGQTYASRAASKTKCKHGHEFTPDNTYVAKKRNTQCNRIRSLRYYHKNK